MFLIKKSLCLTAFFLIFKLQRIKKPIKRAKLVFSMIYLNNRIRNITKGTKKSDVEQLRKGRDKYYTNDLFLNCQHTLLLLRC